MKLTYLVLSFDTEDFESDTDDAILFWANTLRKYGLKGCFCIVGEKARTLIRRGRRDIVEALSSHEIDYHSNYHSVHPTHVEVLEGCGWNDGVEKILSMEASGLLDVETIFNSRPVAYCKPGSSWGPQSAWAMRVLGMPVFCDAPFEFSMGKPMWYCGQLLIRYHMSFDEFFDSKNRTDEMIQKLSSLCSEVQDGCIVVYTHPCRLLTTRWTENFRHGKNTPRERWEEAPRRSRGQVESLKRDFEAFISHIASRRDIKVITYSELYEMYREDPLWLSPEQLVGIAEASSREVNYQTIGATSLSPAEILWAIAEALVRIDRDGESTRPIPVLHPLGPTTRPRRSRACYANLRDVLDAAERCRDQILLEGAVPSSIVIGSRKVGPGSCLRALSGLLVDLSSGRRPRRIRLPEDQPPKIAEEDFFKSLTFKDSWSILPPGFEGRNVVEMARRQAWTAKPAIRRQ